MSEVLGESEATVKSSLLVQSATDVWKEAGIM